MALRAMYKGFKKVLAPLIINRPGVLAIDQDALNAELSTVFSTKDNVISNTKLIKDTVGWSGKNLNGTKYVTGQSNSVNWVANADGSITAVSGTATGDNAQNGLANPFTAKYTGQVLLTGGYDNRIYLFPYDVTDSARPYTDSTKTTRSSANQYGDTPLSFYMEEGHKYSIVARVAQGNTANNTTMYPMIRDADILDDTYEPYHDSVETILSDHKTTINAIITAATGAADFAAFKTAMEAITPVTRSAAPEATREAVPEEVTPEEEPVKKTTRKKSTAKAETEKEGE